MVVTDPTIDPITGLPLLNPQGVIQQIPLGNQVFPYDDLSATARPTRGPLYGDDILPTSAFVAAQHPTTGNAQTVGTDGNHAMLVKDVDSGGGAGPLPIQFINVDNVVIPGGEVRTYWATAPTVATFYGFTCACYFEPPLTDVGGNMVTIRLTDQDDSGGLYLGTIQMPAPPPAYPHSLVVLFPFPIDLQGLFPSASELHLNVRSFSETIVFSMTPFFSPGVGH